MYKHFFKRFLDIFLSAIAILILSPIYIIIAVCVRIWMGSPILFSQDRIGKGEKIFKMYKFRSMTDARDANGNLLPEKDRLPKFGVMLRSSSMDELPELFAILMGHMSFVGPRPLRAVDLPYFKEEERARHNVRGGLIPPDSLSFRTITTYEEQFEYEVYYANHMSLWLDIKVIFTTFVILFKRVEDNYGTDDRPLLKDYRINQLNNK
ncbi:MAG: sugar transferase [Prevotellaceae bacterium]|nr:sugar transferase [Candidatus Colivivens equi]